MYAAAPLHEYVCSTGLSNRPVNEGRILLIRREEVSNIDLREAEVPSVKSRAEYYVSLKSDQ